MKALHCKYTAQYLTLHVRTDWQSVTPYATLWRFKAEFAAW